LPHDIFTDNFIRNTDKQKGEKMIYVNYLFVVVGIITVGCLIVEFILYTIDKK
jgi:hypothetical protein